MPVTGDATTYAVNVVVDTTRSFMGQTSRGKRNGTFLLKSTGTHRKGIMKGIREVIRNGIRDGIREGSGRFPDRYTSNSLHRVGKEGGGVKNGNGITQDYVQPRTKTGSGFSSNGIGIFIERDREFGFFLSVGQCVIGVGYFLSVCHQSSGLFKYCKLRVRAGYENQSDDLRTKGIVIIERYQRVKETS